MKIKQYCLTILASTCLLPLMEKNGAAFQLTFGSNSYIEYEQNYELYDARERFFGEGTVQMAAPFSIELGGTDDFMNTLKNTFQDWTFEPAEQDLEGSFELQLYDSNVVQLQDGGRIRLEIGGQIILDYKPGINDPRPERNELHWIQRVVSNHSRETNQHGDDENVIDIYPGQNNPFYDLIPTLPFYLGGTRFVDGPRRPDITNDHLWLAELYLVEVKDPNKPKKVTIHNGISWGWRNIFTPVQASAPTDPPPACDTSGGGGGSGGGSGGGGCSESNWAGTNNRELPLFQEDEFDSDDFYVVQQEALELNSFNSNKIDRVETSVATASKQIPQSIPEPGTVAGILTIGLLGIGGQLRKRK